MRLAVLLLLVAAATVAGASEREVYQGHRGRWVTVVATGYSPTDQFTRDDDRNPQRLTADGTRTSTRPYGIAAPQHRQRVPSWNTLPFGTQVIIPVGEGYLDRIRNEPHERVFEVDDTGAIINERTKAKGVMHIDLRFKDEASALRFGVRRIRIFVIDR